MEFEICYNQSYNLLSCIYKLEKINISSYLESTFYCTLKLPYILFISAGGYHNRSTFSVGLNEHYKMFNEVNNFLNLKGDSPPPGECILVSDFTCDYGSFLVHHFISYFLKNLSSQTGITTNKQKHVCLVSFAQSFNHFHCVAQKFGLNLRQLQQNGSFVFVDGLKFLGQAISRETETTEKENPLSSALSQENLKDFFFYLISQFKSSEEDGTWPVVIVDNLSILLSLGVPLTQLTAFYQSLRSHVCMERTGSLIVYLNVAEDDEQEQLLLKHLCHMSDCHLQVRGLSTGYCKDIHGELTATWHELSPLSKHQSKTTQFKLLDKNVSLFAAGMSQAVL